ncbi:MAG: hypothetical protein R3F36_07300 [Candidatus Competibacteraceae bacterium]
MLVVVCRSHSLWRLSQLAVFSEGHVALDDAGPHACPSHIRGVGVLGELQGGAPMADGKVGTVEGAALALRQPVLEAAFVHAVDQVERPGTELYAAVFSIVVILVQIAIGVVGGCEHGRGCKQRNGNSQGIDGLAEHGKTPLFR